MCTGVAPMKVPDKAYGVEAVTCNWVLKACNIVNQIGSAGVVGSVLGALGL